MTERPISNVSRVEEYAKSLNGGVLPPNQVIAEAIGLTAKQVGDAISKSRRQKKREIPEVLRYDGGFSRRNEGIMLSKGNIWPDVEPYARIGMRPREIHQALMLEKKEPLMRILLAQR